MSAKMIDKVVKIDDHRNGISGEPFHVVKFVGEGRNMLAVVFNLEVDEDEKPVRPWNGRVAVFDADKLVAGDVAFDSNSWRGDNYEDELRAAIAKWHKGGGG